MFRSNTIIHFQNKRKIICFNKNSQKSFERDLKIHSNEKSKFKTIILLERKNNKFIHHKISLQTYIYSFSNNFQIRIEKTFGLNVNSPR